MGVGERQGRPPVEPAPSEWTFPDTGPVDDSGMVAIGADLEPGTLLEAYRCGLFPMPVGKRRIGWFSPDPRGIIPLDGVRVTRSLRRSLHRFTVTMDTAFTDVVRACGDPRRPGGWIDDRILAAYSRLHEMGWAHSVEAHLDGRLVGGLYGVRIDGFFAGEAMFHTATDASKVALVHLVEWLTTTGGRLLDVQWTTEHLMSLGAIDVPRREYLVLLEDAVSLHSHQNHPH